jgi:glycosyltransferase involved in cell wall biosynthesis
MDIILEIQHAVNTDTPRGVGNFAEKLTVELLRRHKYEYGLSYFKYGHEAGDRQSRAKRLFGGAKLFECASLNYSDALRNDDFFLQKSYEDYIGGHADLFHFMNIISIPTNINGKMLVTVHDLNWVYHDEACSPVIHELVRIGWARVRKMHPFLVAVSENTKREIMENSSYGDDEIAVIYPGYDKCTCYPDNDIEPLAQYGINTEYIFFIGVFERKKNIPTIIRMFNVLAAKYPKLQLVLAGQPTWDDPHEIHAEIKTSPFNGRIITPGYVSDDIKRILYSNALLFIFPSICEGFGFPMLEAFACGCPVVASDCPALVEVSGGAALLGNAGDANEFAEKVETVIHDRNVRESLIAKGFERASNFSWQRAAEQTEQVYSRIIGK